MSRNPDPFKIEVPVLDIIAAAVGWMAFCVLAGYAGCFAVEIARMALGGLGL